MADEDLLRQAVDTAWSVYRATHNEVHGSDERRCGDCSRGGRRERMMLKSWRAPGWLISNDVGRMSHLKVLIGRIAVATAATDRDRLKGW